MLTHTQKWEFVEMNQPLDFQKIYPYLGDFIAGTGLTMQLSVSGMLIGLAIAIPAAWARTSGPLFLRRAVGFYVEIIRNTPLLIQAYLVFFVLPTVGIRLLPETAATLALAVNAGAFSTEIVRAGIQSIDRGQIEAGRALGLREYEIFICVILRPALKNIYPALTSQFIFLMLISCMVSMISANELTAVANYVQSVTFRAFEVYLIATMIYLILSSCLSLVFSTIYKAFIAYPTH